MTLPATPAEHLAAAREKNGRSYDAVLNDAIRQLAGVVTVTKQTIANYHNPEKFPAKPDVFVLMAIASSYGLTLSDIGIDVPESVRDMVMDAFRWERRTPARAAA